MLYNYFILDDTSFSQEHHVSCVKEQIDLVEKEEILKTDIETTQVLNTFFGNTGKILKLINIQIWDCDK